MQPEQRIIAEWMRRQMSATGLSAEKWAKLAGIAPTNITRAVKDDYASVTSIKTLDKLAKAIETDSVLDFLCARPALSGAAKSPLHRGLPNVAALETALLAVESVNVHAECTSVNIEHVRFSKLHTDMDSVQENAEKLRAIGRRSGLAGDDLAIACGWKGRNGPQPYFEGKAPLTYRIAAKFIKGLEGRGDPAITKEEILALVHDDGAGAELLKPQPELPNEREIEIILMAFGRVVRSYPTNKDDAQAAAWLFRDTIRFLRERPGVSVGDVENYLRGAVSGSRRLQTSPA